MRKEGGAREHKPQAVDIGAGAMYRERRRMDAEVDGAGPPAMVVEKDVVGPSAMVVESDSAGLHPWLQRLVVTRKRSRPDGELSQPL